MLSLHALPPRTRRRTGRSACGCARTRLGLNPALAGLKTLNRLESVMARAEWRDERIWEGLMRDVEGSVVCGTMSNVFLRRGSTLMTPALDRCGIAGVMRRWVLEQARDLRLRVWQGASARRCVARCRGSVHDQRSGRYRAGGPDRDRPDKRLRLASIETAERLRARLELE